MPEGELKMPLKDARRIVEAYEKNLDLARKVLHIFYLDENYETAAKQHLDKHVVKMIIEYAQLMSTAHRVLDGTQWYDKTAAGRKIARWEHPHPEKDQILYKASHINHPSGIWARESFSQSM